MTSFMARLGAFERDARQILTRPRIRRDSLDLNRQHLVQCSLNVDRSVRNSVAKKKRPYKIAPGTSSATQAWTLAQSASSKPRYAPSKRSRSVVAFPAAKRQGAS